MNAAELVALMGSRLIGEKVRTIAMGDYPGGVATVTELQPDPAAPEIVFQVKHPTFGTMGIFESEAVSLVP